MVIHYRIKASLELREMLLITDRERYILVFFLLLCY